MEPSVTRIGIAGWGAAGQAFAEPLRRHPGFRVAAICDPQPEARADAAQAFGVPGFETLEAILAAGGLDAVYVATPTDRHRDHGLAVLAAGCHLLMEKPAALTAAQAGELARAALAAERALVVGHSHGHDLPVAAMAEILRSGRLGAVRMVQTWNYTDWVYRPRRPDELRSELGGGITFRQGAHQFDILLDLCGAPVVEVYATAMDWDPARPVIGAHQVQLRFANGAVATAVYNGYGRFLSSELTAGVGEWGYPAQPGPGRGPASLGGDELAAKRARAKGAIGSDAPHQPHFGLTLVSAERGDIRQTPDGLALYTEAGREEIALPNDRTPRELVLDEFARAIAGHKVAHDGARGAHVLAICEAVLDSSRRGAPVRLDPVPAPAHPVFS